ncbi:MAG: antitoxin Xre/MbcA/ParS toxin-binding domain-containing protein [Cytophagales bacterium]
MKTYSILEDSPSSILNEANAATYTSHNGGFTYIDTARLGLTKKNLLTLKKNTNLDLETLSNLLDINPRTIQRREDDEPFKTSTSEKMLALADLYEFGFDVFEERDRFYQWMNTPILALGQEKPIAFLDTFYGINEVKNIIGRMAYGIPS